MYLKYSKNLYQCDKIINFITESISLVKFGVLKGRSTLQQLLVFLNFVHNNHDQQVDIIYLHIKKAFDSIPHDKLLHKLIATAVAFREICGSGSRATYLVEHSMFVSNSHYLLPCWFYPEFPKGVFWDHFYSFFIYERSTILCYCQYNFTIC